MTTDSARVSRSSSPAPAAPAGTAWYRNFWPVFIAALMAVSIGASLATVAIAYRHADVDVRGTTSEPIDPSAPSEARAASGPDRAR